MAKEKTWTRGMDAELLRRREIEPPESFSTIARAMGVSKNAAIGRYQRLIGADVSRWKIRDMARYLKRKWPLSMCNELPTDSRPYAPITEGAMTLPASYERQWDRGA